ncbi:MAG: EF-P lysine aminoacylase EpmA [Desulfobulbaceae bacterium]|nr:EF-P lysine aminoacylase EpmA [Desulfobulbaceae bacterium]
MSSLLVLQQRSRLLQAVRTFFTAHDFLEVDTPILLPTIIPESQILSHRCEGSFLHTSPELAMKMLLADGAEKLFQICHCFRKGERGRLHLPEFTMLEWYRTGWSYKELMNQCEELIGVLVGDMAGCAGIDPLGFLLRDQRKISLAVPWERLSVKEAFVRYGGITPEEAISRDMFDEILVTAIEPNLGWQRPTFLYDYPVALGSLARSKQEDPAVAERFELYIGGIELANGFSELIDPEEQRSRFIHEIDLMRANGITGLSMPDKFLQSLSHMRETAGIALGFDRLLMLLLGTSSVEEVVSLMLECW